MEILETPTISTRLAGDNRRDGMGDTGYSASREDPESSATHQRWYRATQADARPINPLLVIANIRDISYGLANVVSSTLSTS